MSVSSIVRSAARFGHRSTVLIGVVLVAAAVFGHWRAGRQVWALLASEKHPDVAEVCMHTEQRDANTPYLHLRVPTKYMRRSWASDDCMHVNGANLQAMLPDLEPATSIHLTCSGDCKRDFLSTMLQNETGDLWRIAERSYHLILMNGGEIRKIGMTPRHTTERVDDPRFSEVYRTYPIGKLGGREDWFVDKDASGKVGAVITCPVDTPAVV